MKTIRKLSFFGILGVVVAVLFLVSISFVQAQLQTQGKLDNPPGKDKDAGPPGKGKDETWAVQIPEESVMLSGMTNPDLSKSEPYEYVNNGKDIIVSVEKKGLGLHSSNIYYMLTFKIVNPTDKYVEFNGVKPPVDNQYIQNSNNVCDFPGPCGPEDPDCMWCFLNQWHPYSDSAEYKYVEIKFWIWGYDVEAMEFNDPYQLGQSSSPYSYNDGIRIKIVYTSDCPRSEPEYHDILCENENVPLNIWIERLAENKWRINVGRDVYNPEILPVYETYCIEKKVKGWVSETVTTLEATGAFSFKIDWINKPK